MSAAAAPRNMCGRHYKRRRFRINRSPGEAATSTADVRAPPTTTRVCVDCKTSKTPLWRGGPAGPQSLCNACGIRYRKRKRGGLEVKPVKKENQKLKQRQRRNRERDNNNNDDDNNNNNNVMVSQKQMRKLVSSSRSEEEPIWALSPHDLDNFDRDSSPNTSKAFEQIV
ncbi:GATA transcription factor 17 [Acorus calamus]|uniref:GATA transcription factor 17 n=1 Tax=Acorus calamus TaxID=4465 RepID=A0AAV9DBC6_ACOCL|nr:GATA transcription factor 17 [Acorus calamus]